MGRLLVWGFAALGILAALAVIFLAIEFASFDAGRNDPEPINNAGDGPALIVSSVRPITGTPYSEIAIGADGQRTGGSGSSGPGYGEPILRNIVLIDRRDGRSRRLVDGNDRIVRERFYLPAVTDYRAPRNGEAYSPDIDRDPLSEDTDPAPAAYYVIRLRHQQNDAEDVLFGVLESGEQRFVLRDIAGVEAIWMQSENVIALIVRKNNMLRYVGVDMTDLRMVADRPIALN